MMEIIEMQKMSFGIIEDCNKKHNTKHDRQTVFPHLVEEIGELAREINHHINSWREEPSHEHLAEEMADVLNQLFILASDYEVNLEASFLEKIKKLKKRFELE